jgi:acetyl-CoA C-acetyltransferase
MRQSEATRRKLRPLARIAGVASHAQAPAWFTTAPVGAIGKLLAALEKRGGRRGIASLCIGGGEATAVAVERVAG